MDDKSSKGTPSGYVGSPFLQIQTSLTKVLLSTFAFSVFNFAAPRALGGENLLRNPGFEESGSGTDGIASWNITSERKAVLVSRDARTGHNALSLPARSVVEQKVEHADPGPYIARCWVKSEADQSVTLLLENPESPWLAYSCAEVKVPKDRWVSIETFCSVEREGPLKVTLGGVSHDFRDYHGGGAEMPGGILVDDCEVSRFEPTTSPEIIVWSAPQELHSISEWSNRKNWANASVNQQLEKGPVFQDAHVVGAFNKGGGIAFYATQGDELLPRAVLQPAAAFGSAEFTCVQTNGRRGVRATSEDKSHSYTAWLGPKGVIQIEANQVLGFQLTQCRLRYGLLPSFVGTDICYSPQVFGSATEIQMPSTQWFVGLADGNDSMLVAAWDSDSQSARLGLKGEGKDRLIDSLSLSTEHNGFSISFVQHSQLWHEETLNEDWLGEYTSLGWERPFPARWMAEFFVSPGGSPAFRSPYMSYSFPIANMKTRMWGVWFEDWNHYPFYFDGPRTVAHFEKTFIPKGNALVYFLEPAAANVWSPCEIVEEALGKDKAAALFDFDANGLRRLKYSTPPEFMYDRPVCATTTRLSKIKKEDKPTVGVNLATHLFEFIREIRGRVDQYQSFFDQTQSYLASEKKAHPESSAYISDLEKLVADAQGHAREAYATPLSAVQTKTDAMKELLRQGKGDGFDCGNMDVRGPAGSQDDLCRRYNRLVIRLAQTAALKCGDSSENALVAKHIWDQSRSVLRQPTRWEPRRTLYFFEP